MVTFFLILIIFILLVIVALWTSNKRKIVEIDSLNHKVDELVKKLEEMKANSKFQINTVKGVSNEVIKAKKEIETSKAEKLNSEGDLL